MQTELIESRTGKKFLIKNFGGYVAIAYISTTICSSSYEQIIVKKLMKCSRFTYQEGITCVLADEDGKEHTALFYELNFDSDIKEIRAHLAQS